MNWLINVLVKRSSTWNHSEPFGIFCYHTEIGQFHFEKSIIYWGVSEKIFLA